MRRPVSFSGAVLAAYVAFAAAAFWTAWRAPTARWVGYDFDPVLFIWHLRWLPFALGHGHDPFTSNYLNYPQGFNLMWNTSILFPAFLLSPLTLLFGTVFSYNVLSTLALALSGWCAYFAFRRYVRREAAAVGGVLYGFSSFMFGQAFNHPHLTIALFPPLVLLLLDEILVRQRRRALVPGLLLGVATGLQVLTGEEIAAATALVAVLGVALLALLHRDELRSRLPYAARAVGIAALAGLAIAAYPLSVQFTGPGRVSGPIQPTGFHVLDLLEFVVPTHRQEVTFASANHLGAKFTGQSEIDGYVGIPLLLLAAFVLVRCRGDRLVRFAGLLAGVVALLSLGPRLHVAGHTLAAVRLPWVVPQRLPVLENILPARLALFIFLLLGLLLAVFVDRVRLPRLGLLAVLAAVFVPLIPNLPYPSTASASPSFFESGAHELPRGSVVLVAPFAGVSGGTTRPMLWQAKAELRFRMPEGYVIDPGARFDPSSRNSALFRRMARIQGGESVEPLTDAERNDMRCTLLQLGVRSVVVGPMGTGEQEMIGLYRDLLGDDHTSTGDVELWPNASVAARRGAGSCA
jgi:Dolichyl-phosphate-mannose-protein mannosyltransferase